MHILKRLFILAVFVSTIFSCATQHGSSGLTLDEAIAVAVAELEGKLAPGSRVAVVQFESSSPGVSDYVMDELSGALVNIGMTVADRGNLEYVFKELNFQMTGAVSDESAQSIGQFLGAKSVITGQLLNLGNSWRFRVNAVNVETAVREVAVMQRVL